MVVWESPYSPDQKRPGGNGDKIEIGKTPLAVSHRRFDTGPRTTATAYHRER